jgi:TolB-like protein/DNA-binding winged helix-turn-helix (wHTH) protein/cytochrome c-type biogenesis protein CcmH/NrfG
METPDSAHVFLFEGYRLDRRGLFRSNQSGAFVPIAVGSRALEILHALVEKSGDLVAKDEILEAVWPRTVVEGSNLPVQVAALRRVLDESRADGSCIQTIPGRGYRFAVPVTRVESGAASAPGRRSHNGTGEPVAGQPEPHDPPAPSRSGNAPPIVPTPQRRGLWCCGLSLVAGALCLVTVVLTASNWRLDQPPAARLAPRMSIVVLPFTDLGDDDGQRQLANGVTQDLTTELSLRQAIRVTSPKTAFTYGRKRVDTRQIGRELGVRYALEGSVQRLGNRLRVNAQLIDTEKDTQLWAARFDRDANDLLALQNEIASQLANALVWQLVASEAVRTTERPDALGYILRGRATFLKPNSPEVYAGAIDLFEHALTLDPQSVEAQTLLAGALAGRVLDQMTDSAAADIARADALVGQALAASPGSTLAHLVKGQVLRAQQRWSEAIPEFEKVLAINPSHTNALHGLSDCKLRTGSIDEVIPLEEQAIRLDPRDPHIGFKYWRIGYAHLLQSRTDDAILWLERAVRDEPEFSFSRAALASAYALNGEIGRAADQLAEARRLVGGKYYSSMAKMHPVGAPKTRALVEAAFFAGLRKAGVLEE